MPFLKSLFCLFIFLISCTGISTKSKDSGVIQIQIKEAIPNPEAYSLITELERDYVVSNLDTTSKSLNVLDKKKYYPLTSELFEFRNLNYYNSDSASIRNSSCGFCAFSIFESSEIKLVDDILRNSRKIQGKYSWTWSPIVDKSYFLSILTKKSLQIKASSIEKMNIEDYSSDKLLSYPIQNYKESQVGKKVLVVTWDDKTQHKIDSIFGSKTSFICIVTVNNFIYISGELDTLNGGVTLRDVNENLLDSINIYFPSKFR